MNTYKIIPFKLGEVYLKRSTVVSTAPPDEMYANPVISFLIVGTNNDHVVLVDTGPCDEEWAVKYHYPFHKEPEEEILTALKILGYESSDLDCVVMTHLHWDHAFNMECFPDKKFYLQKSEIDYAIDPLPMHYRAYEAPQLGMRPPWLGFLSQFVYVKGDYELFEGIDLIPLPGHTPGSQGVLVNTERGKYLIAGDCIQTHDNWKGNVLMKHIPSGLSSNLAQYFETFDKIERLKAVVIPAHDTEVLTHSQYPDEA